MMGTLGEEQGTAIWNALAGNTELMQALQESFNMMPQGIPPPSEDSEAIETHIRHDLTALTTRSCGMRN